MGLIRMASVALLQGLLLRFENVGMDTVSLILHTAT